MRAIFRDLERQPWRTALTVAGIAIGIFALVVLGALGEHFRQTVEDAKGYVRGTIRIATKTNAKGENPGITEEDVAAIRATPGVRAVSPTITILFDGFNLQDDPLIFLAPKPLVEGLPAEFAEKMRPGVRLVDGRWLRAGDVDKVMVVRWLARRRDYRVGQKVDVRHIPHEVIGIFEAPDIAVIPAAIVGLDGLKRTFENPNVVMAKKFFAQKSHDGTNDALTAVAMSQIEKVAEKFVALQGDRYYVHEVLPQEGVQEHALAEELKARFPHIAVIEPEALAAQMEKAVAIFLAITAIMSVVSSLVGGLLIVNTMAMAVIERRREISIKVAIGASTGQIAREFVLEAGVMGLAGAVIGVVSGVIAISVLDPWIVAKVEVGASLFTVTPALVLGAVGFGVGLGVAAGLVPAWRAARVDPAPGLREL